MKALSKIRYLLVVHYGDIRPEHDRMVWAGETDKINLNCA